jgi:hypothetical protein
MIAKELPPERMAIGVTSTVEHCKIRITWTKPFINGSPINYYVVQVYGTQGFTDIPRSLCQATSTQTSCLIDIDVFAGQPFNLND